MIIWKKILLEYKNVSLTVKSTIWFTVCNFVIKGFSFFTVPLFAHLLSVEEYGVLSIYSSYEQVLLILATFELSLGAYQRGILKYKHELNVFNFSLLMLSNLITIVFYVLIFHFRNLLFQFTGLSFRIVSLMTIYFLVSPAYTSWLNEKRFKFQYINAVIFTLLFTFIPTIVALLTIIYIKATAELKIVSTLIAQILFCIPFYLIRGNLVIAKGKLETIIKHWKFCLSFQIPLVIHSLSYLILAQSDRIMIGKLVGNSEAGIYSVAYSISNVATVIQLSVNQVFKPWRYQKLEEKEYKNIKDVSSFLCVVIAIVLLLFFIIVPELMKILFKAEYYEGMWSIPPLACSTYFIFLYSMFTDVESFFGKTKYIMYVSLGCALINIALNYIVIELLGYIACGYTTLICYILFAILHYIFMKNICNKEGIDEEIFNMKLIIALSLVIFVCSVIISLLYKFIIIRYAILMIVTYILYKKKKDVKNLFIYFVKY